MKNLGIIGGRISVFWKSDTKGFVLISGSNTKEMSAQEAEDLKRVLDMQATGVLAGFLENNRLESFTPHVPPKGFCAHGVQLETVTCHWCEQEKCDADANL